MEFLEGAGHRHFWRWKLAFQAPGMTMDRQGAERPMAWWHPKLKNWQGFPTSFLGYNATGQKGLEGADRRLKHPAPRYLKIKHLRFFRECFFLVREHGREHRTLKISSFLWVSLSLYRSRSPAFPSRVDDIFQTPALLFWLLERATLLLSRSGPFSYERLSDHPEPQSNPSSSSDSSPRPGTQQSPRIRIRED